MNLEREQKMVGFLYPYICICARIPPLRLYLHLYTWAEHLYAYISALCLKVSMYEFIWKKKRSSRKKKRKEMSGKSQNFIELLPSAQPYSTQFCQS